MFLPGLQSGRRKMGISSQAIGARTVRHTMIRMVPVNYEFTSSLQASAALGMTRRRRQLGSYCGGVLPGCDLG